MLVYPSGLDVSTSALRFLSARLREHRRGLGTRWRRLSAGRQALLTLAHLRNGHPYAQLAAGFGVGTTTAYRYIAEAVKVPVTLAPTLAEAVRAASSKDGMNVQVIADPAGRPLWASPALPGAIHDVRAAREHGIIDAFAEAVVNGWADKGYQGAGST